MRTRLPVYLPTILLAVIALLIALDADAGSPTSRGADGEQIRRIAGGEAGDSTVADREALRSDLAIVMIDLAGLAETTGSVKGRDLGVDGLDAVTRMGDRDLDVLLAAGVDVGKLSEAARKAADAWIAWQSGPKDPPMLEGGAPNGELPDADYFSGLEDRPSTAAALVFLELLILAQEISETADPACSQTAVVLGNGGNGALACLALRIAAAIARAVYDNLDFFTAAVDSSEIEGSYERLGHVDEDLFDIETKIDQMLGLLADIIAKLDTLLFKVDDLSDQVEQSRTTQQQMLDNQDLILMKLDKLAAP